MVSFCTVNFYILFPTMLFWNSIDIQFNWCQPSFKYPAESHLTWKERKSSKKVPMEKTYPLGRPLSLISGTKEVGVLDNCVSGADEDAPDKTVLEVWEATENTPGLALPFADSVANVWASELTLPDRVCDVEPRGLYGKSVPVPDERDTVTELWQALDVPCGGINGIGLLVSMLENCWKNLKCSRREWRSWIPLEGF